MNQSHLALTESQYSTSKIIGNIPGNGGVDCSKFSVMIYENAPAILLVALCADVPVPNDRTILHGQVGIINLYTTS